MKNTHLTKWVLGTAIAIALALTACGGSTNDSSAPASPATPTTPTTVTVQATETPATVQPTVVESKYDEAWARKQLEPALIEIYETIVDKNWSKSYDWYSEEAREGCSRSTYIGKMAVNMTMMAAFGLNDDYFKAMLQDAKDGKMVITFQEITKDRITYILEGDDSPAIIVRRDGKWQDEEIEPLGQDCSSLDIGGE